MRRSPLDLILAAAVAVVAGVLALALPLGNPLRLAFGVPAVFVVPGYLALQAAIKPGPAERRPLHLLFALGLSPAIVGLLALTAAIVPGGFKPAAIVVVTMVGCLAAATVAFVRRRERPAPEGTRAALGQQVQEA